MNKLNRNDPDGGEPPMDEERREEVRRALALLLADIPAAARPDAERELLRVLREHEARG